MTMTTDIGLTSDHFVGTRFHNLEPEYFFGAHNENRIEFSIGRV